MKHITLSIAIFLFTLIFSITSVAASPVPSGTGEAESDFEQISFDSLGELKKYIKSNRNKEITGTYKEIHSFLFSIDNLYIPQYLIDKTAMINQIVVSPTFCEFHYLRDGKNYRFGYYHSQLSGTQAYNSAKRRYDDKIKRYSPEKQKLDKYEVYSYYAVHNTWYLWQEQGRTFFLRIDSKPHTGQFAMCKAAEISLSDTVKNSSEKSWRVTLTGNVVLNLKDSLIVKLDFPERAAIQKNDMIDSLQEIQITDLTNAIDANGNIVELKNITASQKVKITFKYSFLQSRRLVPKECTRIEVLKINVRAR